MLLQKTHHVSYNNIKNDSEAEDDYIYGQIDPTTLEMMKILHAKGAKHLKFLVDSGIMRNAYRREQTSYITFQL